MKNLFRFLRLLSLLLVFSGLNTALANDPAPAKEEKKADAQSAPAKEEKKPDGKGAPAAAERPKRTFEGQEPLFYFDSKRRPYIEPFHKVDGEEYFICRGVIGEWYRQLLAQEANMLAEKDGMDKVTGSTCAVRLVATNSGKKLPVVSIELYTSSNVMRSCILGDSCPQSRTAIMYVLNKTLYRSWFITDREKKIRRFYCLDNKSNILAKEECWYHFFDKAAKEKPAGGGGGDHGH
ncbi:MAG: hypothetical protein RJB47_222 [Pseudomonadota bacterium]